MDQDMAPYWPEWETTKKNSVVIGGIYCEHQHLGGDYRSASWLDKQREQEKRWVDREKLGAETSALS